MRRVVVTGLGLVTPCGNNVQDSWRSASEGKTGVGRISLFDASDLSVHIAAEVKGFDIGDTLELKEIKRTPRFVQFAAQAAREALTDAGLYPLKEPADRIGVVVGVGMGGIEDIERSTNVLRDQGPKRVSPFFMPYCIANMAAGVVSRIFSLRGPNLCTTTACTSGTHAVGEALMIIRAGMADAMIAGGSEGAISRLSIAAFAALKALSTNNEHPEFASRPFDLERDGFVMGEGAGILMLEELEHAKKRGAKIYCELVGYGMSGDAFHITAPPPDGEGAQRCMAAALQMGEIPKEEVDYINAHGTSTGLNDKYESAAIRKVFGPAADTVAISSTKGVTGHCLGAAGGIEAVFSVLAMHHNLVPPTAGLKTPDPECPLNYTPHEPRQRNIRYAMSNSFGFGGTNATIAFKRFQ